MYLVIAITNYGNGYYIGGVYRNYEKAVKRLNWCEKHTIDPENDSWDIVPVKASRIREPLE